MNREPKQDGLYDALHTFKRVIILILLALMAVIIVIGVIYLVWSLVEDLILDFDMGAMDKTQILHILGILMVVIIGLELMDLLLGYVSQGELHIQLVLFIAIIAIAREFLIYNYDDIDGMDIMSMGVAVLALSAASYLIFRQLSERERDAAAIEDEGPEHR